MSLADKISDSELEVMRILWREGKAISFSDIRVELQSLRGWDKSTINTLIRRLADKGVISAVKREIIYYTANISRAEYTRTQEKNMLDKLYDGSAKNFVAALCDSGKLSEADIDELKKYFQMGGSKK